MLLLFLFTKSYLPNKHSHKDTGKLNCRRIIIPFFFSWASVRVLIGKLINDKPKRPRIKSYCPIFPLATWSGLNIFISSIHSRVSFWGRRHLFFFKSPSCLNGTVDAHKNTPSCTPNRALKYDPVWSAGLCRVAVLLDERCLRLQRGAARTCYFSTHAVPLCSLPTFHSLFFFFLFLPRCLNKWLAFVCSHPPVCCPWPQPSSAEIKTQQCSAFTRR